MRKLIFALVYLFAASTCLAQDLVINVNELSSEREKVIEYIQEFNILAQLKDFEDFEYVFYEESNKGYLQGMAKTMEDENVIFRVGAELLDGMIMLKATAANQAESCSGVNCEECAFAQSGKGCVCKRHGSIAGGASYCNHSISR